jgi:hypothetical protein
MSTDAQAESPPKQGVKQPSKELLKLVADWNAASVANNAFWREHGKPNCRTKAGKVVMQPSWDRIAAADKALAPALFEWAWASHLAGLSLLSGHLVINYKAIRQRTGLTAKWNVIAWLLETAAKEEGDRKMGKFVRTASPKEWKEYMAGFCTQTQEGKDAKAALQKARAEYGPKATKRERRPPRVTPLGGGVCRP